ncbi:MAG: hypothetical protein HZA22_01230 [Nitrospirae bacterium]|nr:hypothetical protein [Nitrospirota bacterium]
MKTNAINKLRLAFACLFVVALVASVTGSAFALTPAGTVIGNSATATYKDDVNNDYTTTSNQVNTTVLAVCGVDVLPDDPQPDDDPADASVESTGVPGQTVNMPFSIKNTGNAEYTWALSTSVGGYTKAIYLDDNGNGIVDAGETTAANITIAMGATKYIVVQVSVPSGALNGATDGFTVTADGAGGCDDTETGLLTVSNDANFTANKAVDDASPSPGGTLTYTITFKNNGLKPAKGRDGYSVDRDNNGSIAGLEVAEVEGILVIDQIPSGATFTSGVNTASGSPAVSPTSYAVYSADGTNWYKAAANVPGTITYVGYFLEDSAPTDETLQDVFAVDQQGTFTFTVTVNSPFIEADGCIDNNADVLFAKSTGANASTTTNTVQSCVAPADAANIAIGGINGYSWNGTNWVTGNVNPAWEEDGTYTDDNYAENVSAGTWVTFRHQARNRSAFDDTITLALDGANSSLPAGAVVELWNSDGSTKLVGDSLGSVTATTNIDFTVKIFIPADAALRTLNGVVDWYATIIATSGNNAAEVDRSRDNIDGIVPASVDIALQGIGGDGQTAMADGDVATPVGPTNDDIPNVLVSPGSVALFPFEVVNTGGSSDSYDLFEDSLNVPAGASVKFYEDLTCSSTPGTEITNTGLIGGARVVADAGNTATTFKVNNVANFSAGDDVIVGLDGTKMTVASVDGTAKTITLTAALGGVPAAGDEVSESKCYVMAVSTLATTPAGTVNLVINANSPLSGVEDDIDAGLTVDEACNIDLQDNSNDQLPAGGSTTYDHTVVNNGNSTVDVDITVTPDPTVLTYTFIADVNGDLTDETYASATGFTVTLAAGGSFNFKLSVQAASDTPDGTTETVVVHADTVDAGGCSDTVNDKTDVIEGFLQLTKVRDIAVGSPHDIITYKITYQNIGTENANNVIITDTIPNDTVFIKAGIAADGPLGPRAPAEGEFGLETNGDWAVDTVYTTASGDDQAEWDSVNNLVRFRVGAGADATVGGTVPGGGTGTIIFQVIIK